MKRTAIAILAVVALAALAGPCLAARHDDFKVIQNAVKHSPADDHRHEVRWFKVLIQDGRSEEAAVKITLPIPVIEIVLASSDCRHFRVHDDRCEIDLKAVWTALKKAGPHALVEINGDDGAVLKVWLE